MDIILLLTDKSRSVHKAISDFKSCVVVHNLNGSFFLTSEVPTGSEFASEIIPGKYLETFTMPYNAITGRHDLYKQRFVVESVKADEASGIERIKANHVSSYLQNYMVSSFKAFNAYGFMGQMASFIQDNPGYIFETTINFNLHYEPKDHKPRNARDLLFSRTEPSFTSIYGGEASFNNFGLTMVPRIGEDRHFIAKYGSNIEKIKISKNCHDFFTSIYPFFENNEGYVELPEKLIYNTNASYIMEGFRTIPLDLTADFDAKPTAAALKSKAQEWLTRNGDIDTAEEISLTLSGDNSKVNLGDDITVYFPPLNLSINRRVIQTEYDVKTDKYSSIVVGRKVPDLPGTLIKLIKE